MQSIFDLERVAAAHWRGTEEEPLGDWLLRAAGGFTGRANSVLPLGGPGLPLDEALAVVTRWYRARGLRPTIAVPLPLADGPAGAPLPGAVPLPLAAGPSAHPLACGHPLDAGRPLASGHPLDDELSERLWLTRPGPAFVMVADLPLGIALDVLPAGWAVRADPEPDDAWAAMYHYRGQDHLPPVARKVLTSAPEQSFVAVRDGDAILAIARVSVAEGWAGLTAVEVHPGHRRRGLGAAITAAACQQAEARGVSRVFLQVETGNTPARALYERLGFRYAHRYHYRLAPA